jgi:hypothetical protein
MEPSGIPGHIGDLPRRVADDFRLDTAEDNGDGTKDSGEELIQVEEAAQSHTKENAADQEIVLRGLNGGPIPSPE